jgi:hypothetical protein
MGEGVDNNRPGIWHSIRVIPRTNTATITTLDKINPLWWCRNLDHMQAPDWHRPGKKFRGITWFTRNSFNNLTFYVVGIADKEHVRSGKYPESIWNPNGGWNYSVAEYKHLRLPMISYRGKRIDFYFGWRTRGNFGIKFNIKKKSDKSAQPPQVRGFQFFSKTSSDTNPAHIFLE